MSGFVTPASTIVEGNRRAINGSASLKFPLSASTHSMVLNFKTYANRGDSGTNNRIIMPSSSVVLPLPRNFQDTVSVGVEATTIGMTGAATRDVYNNTRDGSIDFQAAGQRAADLVTGATINGANLTDFSLFAMRNGLASFGTGVEQGLSVASGTAVNPHQALLFTGVPLKQFTFEWNLIPSNEREADVITRIVNRLKKGSLPTYQGLANTGNTGLNEQTISRALFNYPEVVDVFFTGVDQDSFPKLKTAMISQITTNYTPSGHFSLNKGSTGSKASAIDLSITIIEYEIHTAEDY